MAVRKKRRRHRGQDRRFRPLPIIDLTDNDSYPRITCHLSDDDVLERLPYEEQLHEVPEEDVDFTLMAERVCLPKRKND